MLATRVVGGPEGEEVSVEPAGRCALLSHLKCR